MKVGMLASTCSFPHVITRKQNVIASNKIAVQADAPCVELHGENGSNGKAILFSYSTPGTTVAALQLVSPNSLTNFSFSKPLDPAILRDIRSNSPPLLQIGGRNDNQSETSTKLQS
jgi:hypothetical protein